MLYQWVARIPTTYKQYKKVVVKTVTDAWVGTCDPVVIPVSVHSAFHEGEKGAFKVKALVSTIKARTNDLTILLTEKAHLSVLSLAYDNDQEKALAKATQDAQALVERFKAEFQDCRVVFWHDFISQDPRYKACAEEVMDLYEKNPIFKGLVVNDAEKTYTPARAQVFPNKSIYIRHTIDDLLEQCIYRLVTAKKGYRFEFYPGEPYSSTEFVNATLPCKEQMAAVHVHIAFK